MSVRLVNTWSGIRTIGFLTLNRENALAEEVRKYHIPDFSNWKNHAAFERVFAINLLPPLVSGG
jgi:hypothetical protein